MSIRYNSLRVYKISPITLSPIVRQKVVCWRVDNQAHCLFREHVIVVLASSVEDISICYEQSFFGLFYVFGSAQLKLFPTDTVFWFCQRRLFLQAFHVNICNAHVMWLLVKATAANLFSVPISFIRPDSIFGSFYTQH